MRLSCGVLAVLLSATPAAAGQAASEAPTGSLEWTARATPTAGRAEPVLRLPFYLLRKGFADIQKEAEESEPKAELDRFVDGLDVSKELKAWMKRTRTTQLAGEDFLRLVKVNDVVEVPEFYDAYLALNAGDVSQRFPTPKYRERDRERNPQRYERQRREYREAIRKFLETNPQSLDGMDLRLTRLDPSQRWTQLETERRRRVRARALELAQTRYLVARAETDLEGRSALSGVPPGKYWLSTLEGEAIAGDIRLRWDLPVAVGKGRATRVELSNVNAVQPARSPQ